MSWYRNFLLKKLVSRNEILLHCTHKKWAVFKPQYFQCFKSFHISYIYLCADVHEHIRALANTLLQSHLLLYTLILALYCCLGFTSVFDCFQYSCGLKSQHCNSFFKHPISLVLGHEIRAVSGWFMLEEYRIDTHTHTHTHTHHCT